MDVHRRSFAARNPWDEVVPAKGCVQCVNGWLPASKTQPERVCSCLRPSTKHQPAVSPFHLVRGVR